MKCPLRDFGYYESEGGVGTMGTDCLKEECAWWNAPYQMCAILLLGNSAFLIQDSLADISDKLPQNKLFGKKVL